MSECHKAGCIKADSMLQCLKTRSNEAHRALKRSNVGYIIRHEVFKCFNAAYNIAQQHSKCLNAGCNDSYQCSMGINAACNSTKQHSIGIITAYNKAYQCSMSLNAHRNKALQHPVDKREPRIFRPRISRMATDERKMPSHKSHPCPSESSKANHPHHPGSGSSFKAPQHTIQPIASRPNPPEIPARQKSRAKPPSREVAQRFYLRKTGGRLLRLG